MRMIDDMDTALSGGETGYCRIADCLARSSGSEMREQREREEANGKSN